MRYLNGNFWRMLAGFVIVLIVAVAALLATQYYDNIKQVPPDAYVANP